MSTLNHDSKAHHLDHTDLGSFFYPTGFLLAAFSKEEDAKTVQEALITGGYDPEDCMFQSSQKIAYESQRDLDEHTSFFDRVGWSYDAVKVHLEAAKEGAVFLFIYAPGETEAERAMNVIRRVPFKFAHHYHRLTIEELN